MFFVLMAKPKTKRRPAKKMIALPMPIGTKKKRSAARRARIAVRIAAVNKSRKRRRRRRRLGIIPLGLWQRLGNGPRPKSAPEVIRKYIKHGERIPKVDTFIHLKEGALVKAKGYIEARTKRPAKDGDIKDYRYRNKVVVELSKGTQLMFLEKHSKFPTWYKFCVIGGQTVWIDISEWIDSLSKMRRPSKKSSQSAEQLID